MGWHYEENDERVGPVELDALKARLTNGSLAADTLVWSDGMPDWVPASSLEALKDSPSAPPPPVINLTTVVKKVLVANYANFQGRASRLELFYWLLALFWAHILVSPSNFFFLLGFFCHFIVGLALFLPTFALIVRRLHDTGRGWHPALVLMLLCTIIPWPVLVYVCTLPSESGTNDHGPNPYGE